MLKLDFTGKNVLVVGGGRGIGKSSVLPSTSRKRQRVQGARKESCYDEFYQR